MYIRVFWMHQSEPLCVVRQADQMWGTTVCSQNINFWYTSQTMYVRLYNVISSGFGVSNGVRQGGILSPYLFCVYMDDLSNKLNDIKVGCTIGATLINHLMYADDLVLLSPSAMGLSYCCQCAQHTA